MYADVILHNAKFYTMDETIPVANKLAIKDGKIIGINEQAESFKGNSTKVVELKNKAVLPGMIESHAHPLEYAAELLKLDLRYEFTPTTADILQKVKEKSKEIPKGEWILGNGWDDTRLKDKRFPTIDELSAAAPDHPVLLKRICNHNAVVNRKALEVCGLPSNPEDPEGGRFHKDPATGQFSGLVQENAVTKFNVPAFSVSELKKAMEQAQQHFLKWGITTVHDMGVKQKEMKIYQQMSNEHTLVLKVRLWLWALTQMGWGGVQEETFAMGIESGFGNDRLNIQGLKYMLDGSVGGKTAAVSEPFENDPDNTGITYMDQEMINQHVRTAMNNNLRISIHGIGDRAIEMALQAIEQSGNPEKIKSMRHRIEHVVLPTTDHLERIAKNNIVAASSVGFIYSIGDSYLRNLGEERAKRIFPHASFKKYGIIAPGNSDMPVCSGDPFHGVHSAVTRKTIEGQQLGTEEKITVEDAIKAYTIDAAYSGFDEPIIGSLAVGKYADLIVLDQDPFTIQEDEIKDVNVQMTMVEGKVMYKCIDGKDTFYTNEASRKLDYSNI
ncbi:amidohydrolase family protein [Bacillus aerolatus]|uniref:Amidohydrolase family protein n=1 Tax=Bacillus aerolatus TaxID=2653354 RepID=A0A6I1FEL6_9BACI|nr:amidohydrolase [Bacillus aerolatus]KAB7706212.1 amidohydrolase family protein [Bacillus aerolatus]